LEVVPFCHYNLKRSRDPDEAHIIKELQRRVEGRRHSRLLGYKNSPLGSFADISRTELLTLDEARMESFV